ncbi:hypothetical protein [Catelliglobosispora koreensis]|uniref:hypothetical protein n=1 Tax=Catelliglobosispora koreensis TaxID=129052 RepID=UPI00035D14AB|nr:hypothetical protein [Catelliglobosispora koreensis]
MNEDFGDIGSIVSAAARAVPPAPQDLLGVRRKAVTRKRRRFYGGSLGIALVTAAAIVVPVALPHPPPAPGAEIASPAPVSPSVKPRPVTMEQRLFLTGGGYLSGPNLTDESVVNKPEDAPPGTIGVLAQQLEVLADGTTRPMPAVKGVTFVEAMVPAAGSCWGSRTSGQGNGAKTAIVSLTWRSH